MPEILLLLAGLAVVAVVVMAPLRGAAHAAPDDQTAAARIRHRAALEALRDVEADHRAGSLDAAAYADELAAAEAQAAATRAALDAAQAAPAAASKPAQPRRGMAVAAAALIGLVLVVGSLLDGTGLANATVVNQPLADARAAEAARQARITELLGDIAADPTDAGALSDLADAYLAGPNDDLPRAAAALQLLINADPGRPDAYERLMTAYLRAGDYPNARAVHDSYLELDAADPAEAAFYDGLIALRGEDDPERALEAFDTFLDLAPDDPRAPMIGGLRDEAAGG